MSTNDTNKPGGPRADEPKNSNLEPSLLDRFKERDLPPWVRALDDKSKVKWDAKSKCFYETQTDLDRAWTFVETAQKPASDCKNVDYDFGIYGILHVALVGDEAWCSLNQAGSIAGIPCMDIPGCSVEYDNIVRGAPGCLNPDGICFLSSQGICDVGIRLEALTAHVRATRAADPSVAGMLSRAILDVYGRDWPATGTESTPVVNLCGSVSDGPEGGQIAHRRFYDPAEGEVRAVLLGTQVWLLAADVASRTGFDEDVLLKIAGDERTLWIPDGKVHRHRTLAREDGYIRFDVIEKFSEALASPLSILEDLSAWVENDLLDSAEHAERGGHVSGRSLHRMLGGHLPLDTWLYQTSFASDRQFFEVMGCCYARKDQATDIKIPLSTACKVAKETKSFIGIATKTLLREGGYLHGGPIDESATATLARFVDLVPDHRGFVKLRKLHEFLSPAEGYDEWIAKGLARGNSLGVPPNNEFVSISSSWCIDNWSDD